MKSFTRFFSKNRGFQRQRLWSPAAAGETPAPRTARNPAGRSQRNTRPPQRAKSPVVQSAIRRWRNPGQRPWPPLPPPAGVDSGGHLLTVVRPTAPGRTRTGGGTHRSRPTNHMGSPLMFVGRHLRVPPCGIWDGPPLHRGEPAPAAGASPRPTNHMGSPLMFVGRHLRVPPCGIWDGPLLHPGESAPAAGASPRPTGRKQSVFTRTANPHCVGRGFTPAVLHYNTL